MAYASVQELAAELRVPVTAANTDKLQRCLDAAAIEMDDYMDRRPEDPLPLNDTLAKSVNLTRATQWFKSNDAAFGTVGATDTGTLQAPRTSAAGSMQPLMPYKQQFGVA